MESCLFCRIARKETPARIIYEDDQVLAFEDIHPQAPAHSLIIPRRHIASLNQIQEEDHALAGRLLWVAGQIAVAKKVHLSGYRVVINTNPEAGQTVYHVHLHVMGGRRMHWPPG